MGKLVTKLVWVLALAILFSATTVLAQTAEVTSVSDTDTTTVTIDDSLDGIVVEEVKKMPTRWGLWWKSIKEKASEVTTLDPVKKAEKRLRFAEERMKYAQYIAENAKDPKKQAWAEKMVQKANGYMEKVEKNKDKWSKNLDDRKRKLVKNLATHQVRREKVMDKLEQKLPEDKLEALRKLRVKGLENGKRLVNAINNSNISSSTKRHLMQVKGRVENHLKDVKDFQVKKKVLLEKAKSGDSTAKEELKKLQDNRHENLKQAVEKRKEVKSDLRTKAADGNTQAQNKLKVMNKVDNTIKKVMQKKKEQIQKKPLPIKKTLINTKPLPAKVQPLRPDPKKLPPKKPSLQAPGANTSSSD
jgi:hypothetical protein